MAGVSVGLAAAALTVEINKIQFFNGHLKLFFLIFSAFILATTLTVRRGLIRKVLAALPRVARTVQ